MTSDTYIQVYNVCYTCVNTCAKGRSNKVLRHFCRQTYQGLLNGLFWGDRRWNKNSVGFLARAGHHGAGEIPGKVKMNPTSHPIILRKPMCHNPICVRHTSEKFTANHINALKGSLGGGMTYSFYNMFSSFIVTMMVSKRLTYFQDFRGPRRLEKLRMTCRIHFRHSWYL